MFFYEFRYVFEGVVFGMIKDVDVGCIYVYGYLKINWSYCGQLR